MSRYNPYYLYVAVGSDGNIDLSSATLDPTSGAPVIGTPRNASTSGGTAQIRVFDLREVETRRGGMRYGEGQVVGWGLRNDVGIAEDKLGNVFSIGGLRENEL